MNSSEPKRTSAYSEDIRWRIIWQREILGYTYKEIAKNLCVHISTVCRIVLLFHTTGCVDKKLYPKEQSSRKLTAPVQLLILNLIISNPGIYLHEIQKEIESALQVEVTVSTICKFLHANGFTRQKITHVALQRDNFLRCKFIYDVSNYSTDMFV